MAIDVRRTDALGSRTARPRLTLAHALAWAVALVLSAALWAALGVVTYLLVSA